MRFFRLVGRHEEGLASGQILIPGQYVPLNDEEIEANDRLISEGLLMEVPEEVVPEEQREQTYDTGQPAPDEAIEEAR